MILLLNFQFLFISAEETSYTTENVKVITWDNQLPDELKSLTTVKYMAEVLEEKGEKIFNMQLETYIHNDTFVISVSIGDKELLSEDYICFSNVLSLDYPYFYINHLNSWIFKNIDSLDSSTRSALNALDHIYVFNFVNEKGKIQVQGKLDWDGLPYIRLLEPIFIDYEGFKTAKLYCLNGIEEGFLSIFSTLPEPYNPLTKKYSASYLVYMFFNRNDVLKDIPPIKQ